MCVFVLVLHCLIFKVLSTSPAAKSVKYLLASLNDRHFAIAKPQLFAVLFARLSYCFRVDSFAIIPLPFPFVNTFLKVFFDFASFLHSSPFCTEKYGESCKICAKQPPRIHGEAVLIFPSYLPGLSGIIFSRYTTPIITPALPGNPSSS